MNNDTEALDVLHEELYWPLVMTGTTGRRRALPSRDPGAAGEARAPALEDLPSATAVGELVDGDSRAHKISKGEISSPP